MVITKISATFFKALTKSPKVALNGKKTNSGLCFIPIFMVSRLVESGITTSISICSNNLLKA
ncbi:hypothetical protein LCGC14_2070530 [marine sediment metagenome]|uniref:Uncharacterized protein n=1 Tax=marine sediment metagenome TaxID=412755 RepID=A0A0F9F5Y1_9ZZZZ